MPRWRRSHYAPNRFGRCLQRPCTFVVGSHCVFVTCRNLSINTRFGFSDTHFCFNTISQHEHVHNSELLLSLCLLRGQQALLDEQFVFLMVRKRRRVRNRRRRRSCWVHPWLWLLWQAASKIGNGRSTALHQFPQYTSGCCLVHGLSLVAYFKGDVRTLYFQDWMRQSSTLVRTERTWLSCDAIFFDVARTW